jgi:PEP-CTERM motif
MFTRPFAIALLLNCIVAALTCCEVRGQIGVGDDFVPGSSALFTMTIGSGSPETISLLSGPFYIHRDAQVGTTINTEIRDLTFMGQSSLGPITVRVGDANTNINGPVQFSGTHGHISQVFSTGTGPLDFHFGNSFFDVFFEVDVAGMTLYNTQQHVLNAPGITALPPIGDEHFPFGSPPSVPLYLRVGTTIDPGNDPAVGIASGSHLLLPYDPTITPEPSSLVLIGIGCLGLLGYRRRSH